MAAIAITVIVLAVMAWRFVLYIGILAAAAIWCNIKGNEGGSTLEAVILVLVAAAAALVATLVMYI